MVYEKSSLLAAFDCNMAGCKADEETEFRMLALVRGSRLKSILKWLLDPQEFLSDYGIRSLSKHYAAQPYELRTQYGDFIVKYDPAESSTGAFGGNSNWRVQSGSR